MIQKSIRFILLTSMAFLLAPNIASAEVRTGGNIIIGSDEVIEDDLFITGDDVSIAGEVNGDVYIAGGRVVISGIINGDAHIVGESILVTGTIADDIRAIGESLTLEGATVNDSLSFLGESLALDSDTKVQKGVLFAGGALRLDGLVKGVVRAVTDTVVISGEVTHSLHLIAREVRVLESAIISGDLNYRSEKEAVIASGAVIDGKTVFTYQGGFSRELREVGVWLTRLLALFSFFAVLSTGLVLLAIFYRPSLLVSERISTKPLSTLGVGTLAFFASILLFALLLITIIGIPLAFLFLSVFIIGLYLSNVFVAIALGALIQSHLRRHRTNAPNGYLSFLIGLVVLYAIYQVPYVGLVAVFLGTFLGIGALVFALLRLREKTA